nr:uncharacterized protein LOC101883144 [Danio rerio]|eukprot:XP_009298902.1 uncharacterized protein LOC101883144 [Danio rerio]
MALPTLRIVNPSAPLDRQQAILQASKEARLYRERKLSFALPPAQLLNEHAAFNHAERLLRAEGTLAPSRQQCLGKLVLPFGQYANAPFHWLAENDVGYMKFVIDKHREELAKQPKKIHNGWIKDCLAEYAESFPQLSVTLEANVHRGIYGQKGFENYTFQEMWELYSQRAALMDRPEDFSSNQKDLILRAHNSVTRWLHTPVTHISSVQMKRFRKYIYDKKDQNLKSTADVPSWSRSKVPSSRTTSTSTSASTSAKAATASTTDMALTSAMAATTSMAFTSAMAATTSMAFTSATASTSYTAATSATASTSYTAATTVTASTFYTAASTATVFTFAMAANTATASTSAFTSATASMSASTSSTTKHKEPISSPMSDSSVELEGWVRLWENPNGISPADLSWVKDDTERGLFTNIQVYQDSTGVLKRRRVMKSDRMWFYPPEPPGYVSGTVPSPNLFFRGRIFVWRPVGVWRYSLKCPRGKDCVGSGNKVHLYKSGYHTKVCLFTFCMIFTAISALHHI